MPKNILIIEDSDVDRMIYKRMLESEGYDVKTAVSLKQAKQRLDELDFRLIIADIYLPDGNGIDFLAEVRDKYPRTHVLMLTSSNDAIDGVRAIKGGALDYVIKGGNPLRLISFVEQAFKGEINEPSNNIKASVNKGFAGLLGNSPAFKKVKELASRVAKTDINVLLLGETGTGKDRLAEAIHTESDRASGPFIAINCSAIGTELLESELFGYKAGAFSGATRDKKGLFEAANNGTIFLDEIGEMNFALQAKVLRILENKSFIKIGDTKTSTTNARLIAATHVNLERAIKQGKFREDLFYRLASIVIEIPPLRERTADILELVTHYLKHLSQQLNVPQMVVRKDFIDKLMSYSWPGNVRELINLLQRMIITGDGVLTADMLSFSDVKIQTNSNLETVEKDYIKKVIEDSFGNKRLAAKRLGISIATLYRKIE